MRFELEGADWVEEAGSKLRLGTSVGEVEIGGLRSYQAGDGQLVASWFEGSGGVYGVGVGPYDRSQTLVIDPLVYSTYLGGSGDDIGHGIAVDGLGQAYITGATVSAKYDVTSGAFQATCRGEVDVFVTKLNARGTALVYSTYLGGSKVEFGHGIAVDGLGQAYITGFTESPDYPTTSGAFQTTLRGRFGYTDVFVTKLNADGTALVYSTFLGGSGYERGLGIAVDGLGQAYITGTTDSQDYPTTSGAFQTRYGGDSVMCL